MKFVKKIFLLLVGFTILISLPIYFRLKKISSRRVGVSYDQYRQFYKDYVKNNYNLENLTIKAPDGVSLSAWLILRPQSKRVIIFCHGYHHSKEYLASLIDLFKDDTLVFFDFRAHGDSGGNKITWGIEESRDIQAVFAYIKSRFKDKYIYGIGYSMGAAALAKSVADGAKFDGLVLDSSFASLEEQSNRMFVCVTNIPGFLIDYAKFIFKFIMQKNLDLNVCKLLKTIKTPVLIIHSKEDACTSVEDAYKLYTCANGPKELWIPDSGQHARIYLSYPEIYKSRILEFFDKFEKSKIIDE